MMKDKTELARVARLAKLALLPEEEDATLAEMSGILAVAQGICDVDLTGYDCSCEAETSELREDVVAPSLSAEALLSSAAENRDGYFCGPTG